MLIVHITDPEVNRQNDDPGYASWYILFPTLDEWKDRYDVAPKVQAEFQKLLDENEVNDPTDGETLDALIDWCRDEFDLHKPGDIIVPAVAEETVTV